MSTHCVITLHQDTASARLDNATATEPLGTTVQANNAAITRLETWAKNLGATTFEVIC